ncbi:hypothetical protein [Nitrosovibrio tenuis]|uniref:GlcNAc-PI de-N-acetylase n=1 Tax=Nitrosovibrio tenuis TaxID=1233 RepID=A0A1H7K0J9_9PROT|nr:hypothetical protein [Nitrosovibrio tenuis]SEK80292.1 hypothetical protein SAMN05216387_10365 [Nitrosovibrio tenuis]
MPDKRSLLVISHPGHELRLYGWIDQVQPVICILTDGSGGEGVPRLDKTLDVLRALGAEIGPICGELSDRRIYEKILHHKYYLFDRLCKRLARLIVTYDIDIVVSDAMEGYNPTHDLCEVLVQAAVAIANKKKHPITRHYTFPLMGDPRQAARDGENAQTAPRAIARHTIELIPLQFKHKLETIRDYASSAGEKLQQEIEHAFHTYGEHAFACEYLFRAPVPKQALEQSFTQAKPFYETYGEKQVAAGRYQCVIRFREHILPLMNRLYARIPAALPADQQQ